MAAYWGTHDLAVDFFRKILFSPIAEIAIKMGQLGLRNPLAGFKKSFPPPQLGACKLFVLHFQRIGRPQLPYISVRYEGNFDCKCYDQRPVLFVVNRGWVRLITKPTDAFRNRDLTIQNCSGDFPGTLSVLVGHAVGREPLHQPESVDEGRVESPRTPSDVSPVLYANCGQAIARFIQKFDARITGAETGVLRADNLQEMSQVCQHFLIAPFN
jgi:hypothetical protein